MSKKKTIKLKELLSEFYLGIAYPTVLNSPFPTRKKDNFTYQVKEEAVESKKVKEDVTARLGSKVYDSETEKRSIADAIGHDIRNELINKITRLEGAISKDDAYAVLVELVNRWYGTDPDVKKSLQQLKKSMEWNKLF